MVPENHAIQTPPLGGKHGLTTDGWRDLTDSAQSNAQNDTCASSKHRGLRACSVRHTQHRGRRVDNCTEALCRQSDELENSGIPG